MTDTVPRRSALRVLGGTIAVAAATGGLTPPIRAHAADRPEPGAGPRVERLPLLHGATDPDSLGQAGHVPGVPRLGVPPLRLADGPAGDRVTKDGTLTVSDADESTPDLRLDQLGGYRRPGERRRVTVRVDARTLSSWDAERHDWMPGTGRRSVWVGASSRDLRLRASVEVGR
ncbi:fibronectin type III-like domain-contianing protein [Streptomyces spinoverrucosus]|uniref:fibronectin type III-like domain-contianing protein n=1 Tax=Streptomyces spinoverrucosus TaxID=284043 RepID=UPI0018C3A931|nr:fibronectin type III-like domain-contianing protein [Streptomyces spinoverrucosus]MBG0856923.1 fibronectin type III-like domain-contianing protein [Streptomyces spinoverrucosus]